MSSESFCALADRLVAHSVRQKLPGHAVGAVESGLEKRHYLALINRASVLALEPDAASRTLAYEICTHALALRGDAVKQELVAAVDVLLARLGNFPGRKLLRSRYPKAEETHRPVALQLEAMSREAENSIEERKEALTDFQLELWRDLESGVPVSVSAPTSAGKSFVLSLRIRKTLQVKPGVNVAYIVPTRALIREVMLRLREELRDAGLPDVGIRCVPHPDDSAPPKTSTVYVLTQERLLTLLQVTPRDFCFALVLIDEAQGIGEGARGILLHTAIEHALQRSPSAELVFASPSVHNPEELLRIFVGGRGKPRKELHSPVAQNFILVDRTHRARSQLHFALMRRGQRIDLGSRVFDGVDWATAAVRRRALLANAVTHERDGCLVYANSAWEAETIAAELAELRAGKPVGAELRDFIDFVKDQVHPNYPLVTALQASVAFHHGEMPPGIRSGIEDLFRLRKIQFICCTSTLLQGVNLPARHLIVEKPRRGNGRPLQQAEFVNLAGRAGRLLREFHGNVWCLTPDEWKNPPKDVSEQPRVHAAFEHSLESESESIAAAARNAGFVDRHGIVTAAIGRILTEHVFAERPVPLPLDPKRAASAREAIAAVQEIALTLPQSVFIRNSTILPTRLENLYQALKSEPELSAWIPPRPFDDDCFDRLSKIFELLQRQIEHRKGIGFRFDALLAVKWMQHETLRSIIEGRKKYREERKLPERKIEDMIRDIVRTVEQRIRFKLVRGLRAYQDVLTVVLIEHGRAEEAEKMAPLATYLECGASNYVALSLISLGFSRTAALLLWRLNIFPKDATPELCRSILLTTNLAARGAPATVRREVQQLLEGRPQRKPDAQK